MPAITARSAKKSVSYHDLYNLSTADLLFDEKKKKRRPASKSLGFFEAERCLDVRILICFNLLNFCAKTTEFTFNAWHIFIPKRT